MGNHAVISVNLLEPEAVTAKSNYVACCINVSDCHLILLQVLVLSSRCTLNID